MKPQTHTVSVPTDRPLISEHFEAVRLSDYNNLLKQVSDLKELCTKRKSEITPKFKRFSHPRFTRALNWWRGCHSVYDLVEYQLEQIIDNGDQK